MAENWAACLENYWAEWKVDQKDDTMAYYSVDSMAVQMADMTAAYSAAY